MLKAMLLPKSFAVLVEPVKKPATVVTSDQLFLIQEPVPARHLPVLPLNRLVPDLLRPLGKLAA